jgi:hypothetical protein
MTDRSNEIEPRRVLDRRGYSAGLAVPAADCDRFSKIRTAKIDPS